MIDGRVMRYRELENYLHILRIIGFLVKEACKGYIV